MCGLLATTMSAACIGTGTDDGGVADGGGVDAPVDAGAAKGLHECGAPGTGEVMDFVAAGGIAVYLVRVLVGQGVGNSGIYDPLVFAYDDAARDVACVTDVSAQSYVNTHHNHEDVYGATAAGVRYEVAWGFAQDGTEWRDTRTLTLVDVATGASIGEPIELTVVAGD